MACLWYAKLHVNRTCRKRGEGVEMKQLLWSLPKIYCGMLIACEQNVQKKQEKGGVEMKPLLQSPPQILDSKHYREAYNYTYSIAHQTRKIGGYHAQS